MSPTPPAAPPSREESPLQAGWLRRFAVYLHLERGYSQHTVDAYLRDLRRFLSGLPPGALERPETITDTEVFDFVVSERRRGLKARSVRRSLAAVRTFFRFLIIDGCLEANPARLLETPRIGQKLPSVLEIHEIERLFRAVGEHRGRYPLRDRAMLYVLYGSGLRVSELTSLEVDDIHWELGVLRCMGKGSRERLAPLNRIGLDHLRAYHDEERPRLAAHTSSPTMFLSRAGKKLGREVVNSILKKNVERAGLTGQITPHTLRHSFATHLLQNGADLRVVQELLGHVKVETTEIYTHIEKSQLKELHRRFHPRG